MCIDRINKQCHLELSDVQSLREEGKILSVFLHSVELISFLYDMQTLYEHC